jgi:hypothetical protein
VDELGGLVGDDPAEDGPAEGEAAGKGAGGVLGGTLGKVEVGSAAVEGIGLDAGVTALSTLSSENGSAVFSILFDFGLSVGAGREGAGTVGAGAAGAVGRAGGVGRRSSGIDGAVCASAGGSAALRFPAADTLNPNASTPIRAQRRAREARTDGASTRMVSINVCPGNSDALRNTSRPGYSRSSVAKGIGR